MMECDGKWFAHCGLHVLWADDEDELADVVARWEHETVFLPEDRYWELHNPSTGCSILVPSDSEEFTDRQHKLILRMVKESLKCATLQ